MLTNGSYTIKYTIFSRMRFPSRTDAVGLVGHTRRPRINYNVMYKSLQPPNMQQRAFNQTHKRNHSNGQRSCHSSSSCVAVFGKSSSSLAPSPLSNVPRWLADLAKLRVLVTVNNGAPFDWSASSEARKQKSSKSSENQREK